MNKVIDKIMESNVIGLTCHTSADGDSVGSILALLQILKKLNKNAYITSKEALSHSFEFLPFSHEFNTEYDSVKDNTDCVIVLDCGNVERINSNLDLNDRKYCVINIDHHLSNDKYGDLNLIDTNASAVGEIIFKLMGKLNVELDKDIAQCLYTSLLTDTGSFRHSNTTRETHAIAGELVNAGINFSEIHRKIFDNKKFNKIKLYGKVIDSIELVCNERVCLMEINNSMLTELGLEDEDTSDVISFGSKIDTVEVTALIKEKENGVKVSLRSKSKVDVRKVAEGFGGGGHTKASGFASDNNLKEIKDILTKILDKELI